MKTSTSAHHNLPATFGLLLGLACWTCNLNAVELGQSQWIGFTQDNRPAQWAARNVSFNRPPADIATWKPTERELRSSSKKSYPSPLLRRQFVVSKPVQSARIAICGLGLYELYLNGASWRRRGILQRRRSSRLSSFPHRAGPLGGKRRRGRR